MTMSGLPTPPMEDHRSHQHSSKKTPKPSKSVNRTSKRSSAVHEHASTVVIDGRHKRVWKACERCRMKKTKCDGESPCKRCKDDGLVCTAGSRKKTEFKQLPRGYAEVLENTQFALIATVQKLYAMLRNEEKWELGEPDLNERGLPVIHDIASRLGCIRPSPDLPYTFPEHEEDLAQLQMELQSARAEMASEDTGSRKHSEDPSYSPALERADRASSSESEHSDLSKDFQTQWAQQQLASRIASGKTKPTPLNITQSRFVEEPYQPRASLDTNRSTIPSPIYNDFSASPMGNASPFSSWAAPDDFLGTPHALEYTASYIQSQQSLNMPRSGGSNRPNDFDSNLLKMQQYNDGMNYVEGTITPGMLDCNTGYVLDSMDMIYTGDYDSGMVGIA